MIVELLDRLHEEAELVRWLYPRYDEIAVAMAPVWTQLEAGLRARFGRQAVVHRADGMIVVDGVTGHRVCAYLQVFRTHADVEYVSAARRRRGRVFHSANAPPDRLDRALDGLVTTLVYERLWAAVSEPEPAEEEPN